MVDTLSFDQAIEILEVVDISKLSLNELPSLVKKAKRRWHPDRIAHQQNATEIEKYTRNFQLIDDAAQMLEAYLKGDYQPGAKFEKNENFHTESSEDILRSQAPNMQESVSDIWASVKRQSFKKTIEKVQLSDGYRLRELLQMDFQEDLSSLAVISMIYGFFIFGILAAIATIFLPVLGGIIAIAGLIQVLACVLGFLPLSRFWLPTVVTDFVITCVDAGLAAYYSMRESSSNLIAQLLINIPYLLAKLIKYVILFPLYELAKALVGDKVVGVVYQTVSYYAGVADWYVDSLISKNPREMDMDDLYALSHLYGEFKTVPK
ncbi:MAG: hypothetical protein MRZ79_03750 [Bacteroidia bacterium]|nr:hypothetical protein [Bacteroidia bacterium]